MTQTHPCELPCALINLRRVKQGIYAAIANLHQGRQIVQIPIGRDLDQSRLIATRQWFHPRIGFLCIVNLMPGVLVSEVICLTIVVNITR